MHLSAIIEQHNTTQNIYTSWGTLHLHIGSVALPFVVSTRILLLLSFARTFAHRSGTTIYICARLYAFPHGALNCEFAPHACYACGSCWSCCFQSADAGGLRAECVYLIVLGHLVVGHHSGHVSVCLCVCERQVLATLANAMANSGKRVKSYTGRLVHRWRIAKDGRSRWVCQTCAGGIFMRPQSQKLFVEHETNH